MKLRKHIALNLEHHMASLDSLLKGPIDRKLGYMAEEETIKLNPSIRTVEYIQHPKFPRIKIFARDVPELIENAISFNIWDSWKSKLSENGLPCNAYEKPNFSGRQYPTDRMDRTAYVELLQATTNPIMIPDEGKTFVNLGQRVMSISDYLFDLTDEMLQHFEAGKKLWLYNKNGNVVWFTRPEFEAQTKWQHHEYQVKDQIRNWFEFLEEYQKAEKIFNALKQKQRLSALPFTWFTAVKVVLSGLAENSWGDGEKSNTVNHLVLGEDIQLPRLNRNANEFLCSLGGFVPATEAIKEYQVKVQGITVDTLPHLITCKNCLSRINTVLQKQKA